MAQRRVTLRNVSLGESDAVDAAEWRDSSAEERLDAVEAIRKATIELYQLDVPEDWQETAISDVSFAQVWRGRVHADTSSGRVPTGSASRVFQE